MLLLFRAQLLSYLMCVNCIVTYSSIHVSFNDLYRSISALLANLTLIILFLPQILNLEYLIGVLVEISSMFLYLFWFS